MNWTKLVEDQIREAMARGEFANLPGAGKPLDLTENPYTPEELRLAYKILKDSGYAPLWIELHKEIEADIAAAGRLAENYRRLAASPDTFSYRQGIGASESSVEASLAHLRDTYAQRLMEINEKIKSFNLLVPIARLQKPLFVVEEEVARLSYSHRNTQNGTEF
jgi:DnaJ family protein C protein 28